MLEKPWEVTEFPDALFSIVIGFFPVGEAFVNVKDSFIVITKFEGLIIVPVGAVELEEPEYKNEFIVLTVKTPNPGNAPVC